MKHQIWHKNIDIWINLYKFEEIKKLNTLHDYNLSESIIKQLKFSLISTYVYRMITYQVDHQYIKKFISIHSNLFTLNELNQIYQMFQ